MLNLFCESSDLNSEADVEALVVERLLAKLGYPDNRIQRKDSLSDIAIPRGRGRENYRPDYVLLDRSGNPSVVIDAKSPSENPESYHYQVSGYALVLNQRHDDNPVQYTVATNGINSFVWRWDNDIPLLKLSFNEFQEDNAKFVQLRSLLAYGATDVVRLTKDVFKFERPDLNELIRVFNECHQIIWKKEALGPTDAFYEFAKLIFIKLREDNRIATMISKGIAPVASDFNFSVAWAQEQVDRGVSESPIGEILFKKVRDDLERKIRSGEKKRIFDEEEPLNLTADTIRQIVEKLEHYDLHGIDEDLNGRMFETFLNATVRGKELGQFFTPRSVVKYISTAAALRIVGNEMPVVLDGCCGSGGFLIEAMAKLVHAIDSRNDLTSAEKSRLKRQLYTRHLYGIDKADRIARIARLNMYLHGDGGSTIFVTDTLDGTLKPPSGLSQERTDEVKELRDLLVGQRRTFGVVLTNPPFSMSYQSKNADEKRILDQLEIAVTKRGARAASVKSNVLFLERYFHLLEDGGELLTVIDNTVLNGEDSQRYRDYILSKFIIRQVIALPFNTFFPAQANVQTSIIHLKKRENPSEEQGAIFMAILNNVGHDDHQVFTPERDNIPKLTEIWEDWRNHGAIPQFLEPNPVSNENLGCPFQVFVVPADDLNPSRLDAFYYAPDLAKMRLSLSQRVKDGDITLLPSSKLHVVPQLKKREIGEFRGRVFRYIEIGDVTNAGEITRYVEDHFENLPTRARIRVRAGDVLFAKNNSSRGTAVIVPDEFDGQLVTTGFIAIRPETYEEGLLLWSIFTSEIFRKQVYYLAITAVQPEIRESIFKDKFLLPIPSSHEAREELIAKVRRVHELQESLRSAVGETKMAARHLLEGSKDW